MRTIWIHTSRPYACTPSTAVKIHPTNTKVPIQPHVNPHNIPKLIPFNHSMTHLIYPWTHHTISQTVQCNTADQRLAILLNSFVFPDNHTIQKGTAAIPLHPQTNKYYNVLTLCVEQRFFLFETTFLFGEKSLTACGG